MSHHQTTSGMERQSQPGLFLVMVCSPNDKPTGCVGSGRVRLPFPSAAELLRGTQTETGGRAGGDTQGRVRHTSGSLACDGNHVVYHSSPAALSACAMLRDIPEDCHIVWKAARHQDPQMAHSEQTRARPIIVLSLRRAALTVY